MNEDFVEKYISDSIDSGVCSPKDICSKATDRIKEINAELINYNSLRMEKTNLEGVLRSFNSEEIKRHRRMPVINTDLSQTELNPTYINILSRICDFIDQSKSAVMPRSIMDNILLSDIMINESIEDNQRTIYMCIKWLLDKGILNRDDSDRSIFIGEKWSERPIATE